MTWTAPNGNDLPEIVGYNIQFSSNNGNTWSEYYSSSLSSSCTAVIPNLINGDAYIFRVQARFGGFGLPGDWSDASSEVIPEAGGDNVGGESSGWPSWVPPWIVDKFESWTHTKPLWDVVDKVKDAGEQRGDMLDQLARGEPVDLQEINDVVFSALGEAGQAAHDTVIDIYDSVLPGFKWGHEIADTLSNVDFTVSGFVSDVWDYIDIVLGDEKTSTTDAVIDLLQNDGNINETSTGTKIQMIEIFIEGWKAWR